MVTPTGLKDVIALGCILEFATALSLDKYSEDYDHAAQASLQDFADERQARTFFRVIMKVFATKYTTLINGTVVHPSYVWQKIMIRFAAAFVTHMKAKEPLVEPVPGRTSLTVEQALRRHFELDYPHLVSPFQAALDEVPAITSLTWEASPPKDASLAKSVARSPRIQIRRKTAIFCKMLKAAGIVEALDYEPFPLYPNGIQSGIEEVNQYYQRVWPTEE